MLVIKKTQFECHDLILFKLENGQKLIGQYINEYNQELYIKNVYTIVTNINAYILGEYMPDGDPSELISINNNLVVAKTKPCNKLKEVYEKYLKQ